MVELTQAQKAAVALIGIAAVVLIGLALVSQYSETLRATTTATEDEITLDTNNTATPVGTTGQYPLLQTAAPCVNSSTNATDILPTAQYSVEEGTTDGGSITLLDAGAGWVGEDVNCTITYLADTDAQGSADDFSTGLAVFATFMAVLVLAIVGKIIIAIFKKKGI